MSVPEGKRTESRLEVQTKAIELVVYTTQICSNEKYFPKRHRWSVTNRILGHAWTIMDEVNTANDIYVSSLEDYKLRRASQTIAKAYTSRLLGDIDVAFGLFNLDSNMIEYWSNLVSEERKLILKWMKSDKDRFKHLK